MSVVKINALDVPPHMADTLEERFAARAGEVEKLPGFEGFSLLRPTDEGGRYFVVTRWESEDAFQAWVDSDAFRKGHAQSARHGPAATGSELLSFEVVLDVGRPEER
ncbi:MAG: antibiotic biosynthesis monooxygenase [Actinomycetota bacterium]|nr:antibiotic biosynthesis monooxygenase [Actinomycetota bacterium]